jgi:dienelactone hydrolase
VAAADAGERYWLRAPSLAPHGDTMTAAMQPYADWVRAAGARREGLRRTGAAPTAEALRRSLLAALRVEPDEDAPADVEVLETWRSADGVAGEVVRWQLGYGPATEAYVLAPAERSGALPGVVALHCHGGFYYCGKEKIADGPGSPPAVVRSFRDRYYDGVAYANELAKRGFVVLVHDVFMWGSRRFDLLLGDAPATDEHPAAGSPQGAIAAGAALREAGGSGAPSEEEVAAYNEAAARHEHVVEKYCRLLGTTIAALVAREDRAALSYLQSRRDVRGERVGCVGLSGGGLRAALLHATGDVAASVVVGMMATYSSLLEGHVSCHTWMLFPDGWPAAADWPDVPACRPEADLLVLYDEEDELFPIVGMRAADEHLERRYRALGFPGHYEGRFYPGGHKFDRTMQEDAFTWLAARLSR